MHKLSVDDLTRHGRGRKRTTFLIAKGKLMASPQFHSLVKIFLIPQIEGYTSRFATFAKVILSECFMCISACSQGSLS